MALFSLVGGCSLAISPSEVEARDPHARPFTRASIWNLPLGMSAVGEPAKLTANLTLLDTIIALAPDAPLTAVHENQGAWNDSRCITTGPKLFEAPIPADLIVARTGESKPPDPWVILEKDGRTLHEGMTFGRCEQGGVATTTTVVEAGDLFGDGRAGGQGASGLSVLGGTLRHGELLPGAPRIRHALKLGIPEVMLSADAPGYRWPADRAPGTYETFAGQVAALKLGALLALPADLDLEGGWLATEPARALAWTLQHYGAYVVHDHPATQLAQLLVEYGTEGSFGSEFEAAWGYAFNASDSAFFEDMKRVLAALEVIDDWDEARYGEAIAAEGGAGGGDPRAPWSSPLAR